MRKKRQKGAAISKKEKNQKSKKKNLSNREHATKFALLPGGGIARKTRSAAKPKAKQNRKEQNEIKSKSIRGKRDIPEEPQSEEPKSEELPPDLCSSLWSSLSSTGLELGRGRGCRLRTGAA